jgi:hypothetical protein
VEAVIAALASLYDELSRHGCGVEIESVIEGEVGIHMLATADT